MVAQTRWGKVSKRCRKSRLKWVWLEGWRRERVGIAVEEVQGQPWWPRFHPGQSNIGGGFPSSWSQMRMDEHISIDGRDGDPSGQSNIGGGFPSSWKVRMDEHISIDDHNDDQSEQSNIGGGFPISWSHMRIDEHISIDDHNGDQSGQDNIGGGFSSSWKVMMDEHISIDDRNVDQSGQNNGNGDFLSSCSQVRMDEHVSVDGGNGDQSTFSAQVGVGLGNTNNRARGANSEMFLQVAQQGFNDAHMILEQNRMLIQDISQNKENRGKDGLTRNVELIRQLNTNIAHVFDLYSNLSGSYTDYVVARNTTNTDETNASGSADP